MVIKDHYEKVLQVFFDSPTKLFKAREISRITRISHPAVLKYLSILSKEGLVQKSIDGYKAGGNESYRRQRRLNVMGLLFSSGLVDHLRQACAPNVIILFGSSSRGEDNEGSDIDLFLESPENQLALKPFERKLHRRINITFGSLGRLNKEFAESVFNGTILSGGVHL
ncbi:MAG: nucleotidyltransferase domain-containing protein [Nanoarchaeota archaeon]